MRGPAVGATGSTRPRPARLLPPMGFVAGGRRDRLDALALRRAHAADGISAGRMLGLVYDVHGNLGALEAVLADARRQGVNAFLLGGDYALFGPHPRETLERLRTLGASWIRGNGER